MSISSSPSSSRSAIGRVGCVSQNTTSLLVTSSITISNTAGLSPRFLTHTSVMEIGLGFRVNSETDEHPESGIERAAPAAISSIRRDCVEGTVVCYSRFNMNTGSEQACLTIAIEGKEGEPNPVPRETGETLRFGQRLYQLLDCYQQRRDRYARYILQITRARELNYRPSECSSNAQLLYGSIDRGTLLPHVTEYRLLTWGNYDR